MEPFFGFCYEKNVRAGLPIRDMSTPCSSHVIDALTPAIDTSASRDQQ